MAKELVCSEDTLQKDLSGKIYVVTGTTSGIGLATVKQLAKQSATVICASRNAELAKKIGAEMFEETSNKNIYNLQLELDSLDCVRYFVDVFNKKFSRLLSSPLSSSPLTIKFDFYFLILAPSFSRRGGPPMSGQQKRRFKGKVRNRPESRAGNNRARPASRMLGKRLWRSSNNPKANWKRCGCSAFFCFAGVSGGAGSGDDDLSPCARAASSSAKLRAASAWGARRLGAGQHAPAGPPWQRGRRRQASGGLRPPPRRVQEPPSMAQEALWQAQSCPKGTPESANRLS